LGGSAQAGELTPYAAESIELGSIRGVTYYTEAQGSYKLVTTLADGEAGLPVRFETILADNQRLTISVPGKLGGLGEVLEILRVGDKIILSRPAAAEAKSRDSIAAEASKGWTCGPGRIYSRY
jgi:hypothetical protein